MRDLHASLTLGWYTLSVLSNKHWGRKFLSHQFTFLETPIFLDLKMNLPVTSLKPVFWSHQCLSTLSNHQTVVSGAPVYRWQRFHQTMLSIFPQYSVAIRWLLRVTKACLNYWLGHIRVCISVWIMVVCHTVYKFGNRDGSFVKI